MSEQPAPYSNSKRSTSTSVRRSHPLLKLKEIYLHNVRRSHPLLKLKEIYLHKCQKISPPTQTQRDLPPQVSEHLTPYSNSKRSTSTSVRTAPTPRDLPPLMSEQLTPYSNSKRSTSTDVRTAHPLLKLKEIYLH